MNSLAYSWWIFLDVCIGLLVFWAVLKIAKTSFRRAFLFLMLATGFYFNLLFAKWFTDLGTENPLLLTRLIFLSGILIHSSFGFFVITLTEKNSRPLRIYFGVFQGVLAILALAAALTELVIVEVNLQDGYPRFKSVHGVLYNPMLVLLGAFGISMIGYLFREYRKAVYPLEKYQLRKVLISTGLVFLGMTFTNGVLPALTKQSYLSVLGGVFPVIFFFSVMYLMADGESILLKREFASLLRHNLAKDTDNQAAIREVIHGLKSILHKGATQISRKFNIRLSPDRFTAFVLASDVPAGIQAAPADVVVKNLGIYNLQLEAENRRLLFSLIRAENLMQEKWLEGEVKKSLVSPLRAAGLSTASYPEVDKSLQEFGEFWGGDILCAAPQSFRLFQKLLKKKDLLHPLFITGEFSTGRATMCRGLHHVRKAGQLIEISCALSGLDQIRAVIAQTITEDKRPLSGILIRHADELGRDGVATLLQIVEAYPDKAYFYITASENFSQLLAGDNQVSRISRNSLESIPLRDRPEDISLLALYFAREFVRKIKAELPELTQQSLRNFARYAWPGNIQELREFVESALVDNRQLTAAALPLSLVPKLSGRGLSPLESSEKAVITQFLVRNRFNKNRTRLELGITLNTLNAKMLKYGIKLPKTITR